MSNTKYNRRSFLQASAVAGGGFVLGFSWLAGCKLSAAPMAINAMPETWYGINAFLKIGENGLVTIMSPNPEIGQNVKTSMPMIVAEELDVDWKDVVVQQASLDTDNFTRQVAGGSQSIRQGWTALRTAGATARRMLLEAAANRLEVPLGELTTYAGIITHEGSGRTLGYGDVASEAALLEVPEDVDLKDSKDFSIIGTTRRNVDAPDIVRGRPLFGIDVQREGMLIAAIAHAPAFGMRLKTMDAAAAMAMPGIVDVFTIDAAPEGFDRQWSDVNAFPEKVVVVGRTTWEVFQAKKALVLEWEQDSGAENSTDHAAGMAALLDRDGVEEQRRDGDPERAFSEASEVIERTYTAPFLPHNTLEPMNFFADVQPDAAHLEGPIQTPESLRRSVASVLDLPEEKISIDMTRMGGGFGRRLYGNFGVEAALISRAAGAPIKLVYTREDDMTQGTYRPAYQVRYRAALNENKELIAFHVRGAGINDRPVFANRFPAGTVDNYLAENLRLDSNVTTGAWRAPRSNFVAGAEQAFLDEVAAAAGKDPIAFRLELFDRAMQHPVGDDNDYDAARYAGVLSLVRDKARWGEPMPGVSRGVSAYYCHNSYVAQVVDVVMNTGRPAVKKVWCAIDCGIVVNPGAARNQVEGGIVDGIGHAMYGALSIADGRPEQDNFHTYRLIRINEAPEEIETFFVDNGRDPTGLGEPSLPPSAAALANAVAAATGHRLYAQPFVQALEAMDVQQPSG